MTTTVDFAKVKSYVESVEFQGLFVTNEAYLKSIIGTDVFKSKNFEELLEGVDKIRKKLIKLGCFKSVEAIVDGSKKDKRSYKIVFDVEEMGPIGGGIHTSVGNNDGSLSTSIHFPNLFGKGERLSAEYAYGTRNHIESRLSYSSPIGFNPNKQLIASLFRTTNDFPWSKYTHKDTGISIDIINPFSHLIGEKYELSGSHILSYEGAWRYLHSFNDSSFDVREQSGHSIKSSLKYATLIDRRDHKALPTKGGYLKATSEIAGLGGDVRFFKFNYNYQYSHTFFKYFTTQFSLAKGLIMPLKKAESISLNDRFFLGGPLGLRGFTNRGVGPNKEDCSLGNTAFWLFGAHLYTPLPFLHNHETLSSWLKTHSFINVGNLVSANDFTSSDRMQRLVKDMRISVGTGVVIAFGNIARVELNYVWPLKKCANDNVLKKGLLMDCNSESE